MSAQDALLTGDELMRAVWSDTADEEDKLEHAITVSRRAPGEHAPLNALSEPGRFGG